MGFNTDLFEVETISRLAIHYHALLQDIVAHPQHRLSSFSLVDDENRANLIRLGHSQQPESGPDDYLDPLSAQLDQLTDEELAALLEKTLADQENGS